MLNVIKEIYKEKLVGIIRENDANKAIEIAKAYIEGGIKIIEMASDIKAMIEIAKIEGVYVGQGGIITREQAICAIQGGAKFLVSPILQTGLIKLSSAHKTPLIATATTPNEAYQAWQDRIPLIKIYPIKDLGGAGYVEELLRPMKFLNIMPTGSITIENIKDYLNAGAMAVGLGRELYLNKSRNEMVEAASLAVKEANLTKFNKN